MEFKSKFELGQEVYLIHNNEVIKETVEYISIDIYNEESPFYEIKYGLGYDDLPFGEGSNYHIENVKEERLFATKQELINSL